MAENNEANREKLANAVVERADMDDTITMAVNGCYHLYERNDDSFQADWADVFDD